LPALVRHASELPIGVRVAAYLGVLLGYIFYCYNFIVVDYVRPFLVGDLGFTVSGTALISIAGNIGVTVGAIVWAGFIARVGLRRAVAITAAGIGTMAVIQASTHIVGIWVGGRFFMAALLGGYYVVATSLVVALFPETSRAKLVALNSAMYPAANIAVGLLSSWLGETGWYALMWLAAAPLPIAILIWFVVPDDASYRPYGDGADAQTPKDKGSWREMLSPGLKWFTIGCILLSGLDFNAYQLFQGFVTLYIHNERGMSAAAMGAIVATISTGAFIGNFLWAAIADRWGRRPPLVGYLLAAVMVLLFLRPGLDQLQLSIIGFVFGLGMSCTAAWGAWFAELFPGHLRTHGAALFHAGHILALGSPLIAAYASQKLGMTTSMSLAAVVYVFGAVLWYLLPETLSRAKSGVATTPVSEAA
jgi:MFS family permease